MPTHQVSRYSEWAACKYIPTWIRRSKIIWGEEHRSCKNIMLCTDVDKQQQQIFITSTKFFDEVLFFVHHYPPARGGSSRWCLYVGRWVLTCLEDFQFQDSDCCIKSYPDNLLLVWVLPSKSKHRKAPCPRTQQHDKGESWTGNL